MSASEEEGKFEQLVQTIAPQSKLRRTWPLAGGISAEMTALEIERPDGQLNRLVVRRPGVGTLQRNPDAAQHEFRLLQLIQPLGLATPTPYYLDPSGTLFPTPFLVLEYVEGKPEFSPAHLASFTNQLAAHLADIHSVDYSSWDVSFLRRQVDGCTETLHLRPADVDTWVEERRIRATLESAWPLPPRNTPVLLHGDYWPGNVLWREGALVAVVDWEDARLGDPLIDLAMSRLDILWIFGIDAMDTFTRHYQSRMAVELTDLPYWDLCAALRLVRLAGPDLVRWTAFFAPFGRRDITPNTLREHLHFFITQALDKLAFQ
jgi:aminoglycoside phosphotransferase (APT) family kinase protein